MRDCGGFPLALEVVGRSLRGQPKEIWKRTLKQWSEGKSIFSSDSNKEILIRLLSSVNSLDEMYKECYLDLASFPEDQRIPATALIDMWVGLYNLDEDGDAIAILHELSKRSLIGKVVTRYSWFLISKLTNSLSTRLVSYVILCICLEDAYWIDVYLIKQMSHWLRERGVKIIEMTYNGKIKKMTTMIQETSILTQDEKDCKSIVKL